MKEELREMKVTNFAVALQETKSIKDAAGAINISERQAHRWLADPKNMEIIKEFNREVRAQGAIILANGKLAAFQHLVYLSQNAGSESVQLKACLAIIGEDFPSMFDIEQDLRLQRVEDVHEDFLAK